jgi:hypothetical protein
MLTDFVTPFHLVQVFTVVVLFTLLVWTWNVPVADPAGTVIELGVFRSQVLLSPVLIVRFVVVALVSETVQVAEEFDRSELGVQTRL